MGFSAQDDRDLCRVVLLPQGKRRIANVNVPLPPVVEAPLFLTAAL